MAKQPDHVDITAFLTVEPTFQTGSGWSSKDDEGRPILTGGRITGVTVNRPERKTRAGGFVTKVTLRVDSRVFLPLLPQAVLHIGPGEAEVIEVVAEDPAYPTEEGEGQ